MLAEAEAAAVEMAARSPPAKSSVSQKSPGKRPPGKSPAKLMPHEEVEDPAAPKPAIWGSLPVQGSTADRAAEKAFPRQRHKVNWHPQSPDGSRCLCQVSLNRGKLIGYRGCVSAAGAQEELREPAFTEPTRSTEEQAAADGRRQHAG